ncbi:glycosyltransferase family 39 protein [Methanobacterium petrolearium]
MIGVIGLYFLLKERFNAIGSLTGCLIFISFPIVFSWAVSGCIDIPGISFSIWTLFFLVIGLKKDYRYLYLVLPTFMMAFLTRYTSGLIILPIFLYLLINKDHIKKMETLKKIVFGISIELVVLITALIYFFVKLKTAASIFSLFASIASSSFTGANDVAYNTNILYYIQNLLNYISVGPFQGFYQQILNPSQGVPTLLAYLLSLIVLFGIIFYIHRIFGAKINFKDRKILRTGIVIKIGLILVLFILMVVSFYYQYFTLSEIILFAFLYAIYMILIKSNAVYDQKKLELDFMFLSWFGAFLIFQSTLPLKVDRYFITMAPALAYFIVLGLSEFIRKFKSKIKDKNFKPGLICLLIAMIFLSCSTATYIGHTPKKAFTIDIDHACQWIKNYDPDYKDKVICSDYPNAVNWYLKKQISPGSPTIYKTKEKFEDHLQEIDVEYYIDSTSNPHPKIEGYHIIKTFGVVAIYKKI